MNSSVKYIYALHNESDQPIYIGQTDNPQRREYMHRQRGLVFDRMEILEVVPKEKALEIEGIYIGFYQVLGAPLLNVGAGRPLKSKNGKRIVFGARISAESLTELRRRHEIAGTPLGELMDEAVKISQKQWDKTHQG